MNMNYKSKEEDTFSLRVTIILRKNIQAFKKESPFNKLLSLNIK